MNTEQIEKKRKRHNNGDRKIIHEIKKQLRKKYEDAGYNVDDLFEISQETTQSKIPNLIMVENGIAIVGTLKEQMENTNGNGHDKNETIAVLVNSVSDKVIPEHQSEVSKISTSEVTSESKSGLKPKVDIQKPIESGIATGIEMGFKKENFLTDDGKFFLLDFLKHIGKVEQIFIGRNGSQLPEAIKKQIIRLTGKTSGISKENLKNVFHKLDLGAKPEKRQERQRQQKKHFATDPFLRDGAGDLLIDHLNRIGKRKSDVPVGRNGRDVPDWLRRQIIQLTQKKNGISASEIVSIIPKLNFKKPTQFTGKRSEVVIETETKKTENEREIDNQQVFQQHTSSNKSETRKKWETIKKFGS